ncbi:helix-turn-helix domain-containing protein [Parvularcula maris]|uniref:Helix-turn-helix domain-containing protein n=1 Tax=Parvularcula maris TaxID=2965077 RepID=A0A9X2LB12_9PROT|nr:helix-turn-helix domain-containing protein [Parvularcula maris]MCQ8186428.1 helix-turn-helix domain-containing protein [Parvularcula maris]
MEEIIKRLDRIERLLSAPIEYVDTEGAATIIGLSVRTLEGLRLKRQGPAYSKVGKVVRYAVRDLHNFMAEGRTEALR